MKNKWIATGLIVFSSFALNAQVLQTGYQAPDFRGERNRWYNAKVI